MSSQVPPPITQSPPAAEQPVIIWPTTADSFKLQKPIGRGSTALVYDGTCLTNNKSCAIKIIDLEAHPNDEDFRKEIKFMGSCNHENVVNYYSCFVVERNLWLVMSLLDAGSLLDVIKYMVDKNPNIYVETDGVFNEAQIATVLKEVAKGLQYLHSIGHIHRDIKAGNILVSTEGQIKIADFGVSAVLNMQHNRVGKRTTFVGTPCWMAPEVMDADTPGYGTKADVWSFGITAIELATGQAPYHTMQPLKVILMTLQNPPPKLETVAPKNKKFSKELRKLVESCLQKVPKQRISAASLLKDPFMKKAKGVECIKSLLKNIPPLQQRMEELEKKRANMHRYREVKESQAKKVRSGHFKKTESGLQFVWDVDSEEENDGDSIIRSDSKYPQSPLASESEDRLQGTVTEVPGTVISLVLRIRSNESELRDVRFSFTHGQDTSDGIANELVQNSLIEPGDLVAVTSNMKKVVESGSQQVFRLPSYTKEVDQDGLFGYAMLSIEQTVPQQPDKD